MSDDRPVWIDHPVYGTPAATAATAGTDAEEPLWNSHEVIEQSAPVAASPAEGYDLYRKATDAANRQLTFGLSDKVGAAVLATGHQLGLKSPQDVAGPSDSWSEAYRKNLNLLRQEGEQFSETNPTASKAATAAGTVGSIASLPSRGIAATAGLLPKIGEGAKIGAAAGGIGGFGGSKDESVTGDLAATGTGAAVGGTIGAGGGAVADRVVSPFISWLTRKFGPNAVENQAVQAIAKRMTQDASAGGPTAQDMIDLLNAAPNKPQTLADVAGENVRQYAGHIARQPGEGRQFIRSELENRDVGAGSRLAGDVGVGISSGGSPYTEVDALINARAAASAPKYRAAGIPSDPADYANAPVINTPAVARLLDKSKDVQSAIAQAKGLPDYAELPDNSIVLLDKAYKNIGGHANEAKLAGNGEKYRDLNSLRLQLRDAITGGNPQHPYQQALDAFSGPSNSISAVREGQGIFNKEPDEIAAEMARLSPSDREFYRLGAAGTLRKNLGSRPGDESKTIVGKDYRQQQLRPLFDTQNDYDRFISSATAENRMFETRQRLVGGSQTAERLAEDNAPEGATGHAIRAGVALAEGAPGAAGLSAMKALGAMTRGESPAVNAAAARMLFRPQTEPQVFRNLKDVLLAQQQRTRPRVVSIPAAAAAGANPVPLATTLSALGQYLPSFGEHR
jgi:hypothetical protein